MLNTSLFNINVLQVKYCKEAMVKLLKAVTVIGVLELGTAIAYAVFVIVLTVNNINAGSARLLLSTAGLPTELTYLHPYI